MSWNKLLDQAMDVLEADMSPEAAATLLGLDAIASALRRAHEYSTDLSVGKPLNEIAEAINNLALSVGSAGSEMALGRSEP